MNLRPRKMSMSRQYFHNGRRKMQQRNLLLSLQFEQSARRYLIPENEQHRPSFVSADFLSYGMVEYPEILAEIYVKRHSELPDQYKCTIKVFVRLPTWNIPFISTCKSSSESITHSLQFS